ncbi:MAG: S41 family peptidase [Ginsengibacter sp.]
MDFCKMFRLLSFMILPFLVSCSVSKNYDPNKKYPREELQQDYSLLRNILEEKHPSLYWYTPKDSMDMYFDKGYQSIADSMTELQFGWQILAPLTSFIRCGHTSFGMSKEWNKFIQGKRIPSFPYHVKVWNDTMMVMGSLNRNDTTIKRGEFITAINGVKNAEMIQSMFDYMAADGYADNVNYIRLSSSFPYFHRNIFGLYQNYFVQFSDSLGNEKSAVIPFFSPSRESVAKTMQQKVVRKKVSRKKNREHIRSLKYDSSFALLTINRFTKGNLNQFIRRSFRDIEKKKVENLVIDLRANSGGKIDKSVLLTRYLANARFKIADSAYSISKNFAPFGRYISHSFGNNIGLTLLTKKKADNNYHFGFWERHHFKPKRKNHYSGNVYILVNGLTFSASTLFCNIIKGQDNVFIAGEETGGGWYGNTGILIPGITLPHTKLKVGLPFFRLVQYQHIKQKGTGIIPDIYIGPNWRDILNGTDTKMEEIKRIINQ